MSKGRVSIDQIVDNGLESQEGLVELFDYPDQEKRVNHLFLDGLLQKILPSSSMPKDRRFTAGYRRFVVLIWVIHPHAFGSSTIKDLADQLNTSVSAIYKIRDELKSLLGTS